MDKLSNKFYCELCERYYKSYQSLWNHNKKFHDNTQKILQNELKNSIYEHQTSINELQNIDSRLKCKFCNNIYKHSQSKNRHEKKCKIIYEKSLENKYKNLKNENKQLKKMINQHNHETKKEIEELREQLRELINKKGKIHYKTLQKINKTGHIDTQNNIENQQNTINIIGFSKENLSELFSNKEKMDILNYNYGSLNKLIEYTHFNDKYPEFKNIKITNLTNNIAYKYDEHKKRFIATTKDSLITDLITNRMYDIETFSLEEDLDGQMNKKNRAIIEKFIEQFYEEEDLFVNDRKEDVKFIIYNGCEQ